MKIEVTSRCESSDNIMMPAKDNAAAEKLCVALQKDDHVMCAKVVAVVAGKAIINHVARFKKGNYTVPDEVGQCLIDHKLAVKS